MNFFWLVASCVLLVFTYVALYVWWSGRRARFLCAGLPGWPELPLLGNVMQVYGDGETIFKRLQEMSEKCEETDSMFQVWLGGQLCLIMSKPELTKAVTNAFIEKPYYYNFGKDWLGDGLVTASGEAWKRNIKKLAGTFTGSIVDGFQDVFNAQARRLTNSLRGEVGQPPCDVMHKYLAYTTMEAICQTSLGMPDVTQSIVTSEYYHAFSRTLDLMVRRGFNVFLHPDCVYRLTPSYREFQRCVKILHKVSHTIISKRRKEWDEIKKNINPEQSIGSTLKSADQPKRKFKTFLDILLEIRETDPTLTEEQIRAEVDTITVGGQETTATTLLYTLLMLGSHHDIQEKLYAELKDIFGTSTRPATKEDLSRMKYCEAVLYETLRLFPALPVMMRYSDRELKLSDNITIPANATCVVNAWGAGRSKRLWGEDVLVYRPERWLEDSQVHPAAFLPFSYGRRSCIGKKYAMALLKTLIGQVIRELRVSSEAHKLNFKVDIALHPISGHLMSVQLRDHDCDKEL